MHESVPFFKLKRCIEPALEQHIRNKIIFLPNDLVPFENDEIHNNFDELENERAISEYDPALLNSTDSYKNASYSVDENNEYMEPTSYSSTPDVGVGYTSVDEHVLRTSIWRAWLKWDKL